MPVRLLSLIRVLVPLALLAALFFFVDIGNGWRLLADASPGPVLAALLIVQLQTVLAAVRWRMTANSLGQKLALSRAISEYYGASLLNLTLPGGISGDVVRVIRNREGVDGGASWERPAQAVLLERASGQVVFAAVAAAGMMLWTFEPASGLPDAAREKLRLLALVATSLLVAAGGVMLFARELVPGFVLRFGKSAFLVVQRPRDAVLQIALSLAVVAAHLAVFALASRAIGAPIDVKQSLLLVPPVLLTMILPVSVGGWGVREVAAAAMWPLAGFSPAEGVAASVLYGLVSTAGALPGLFAFGSALSLRLPWHRSPLHGSAPPVVDEERRA